MKRILLFTLIVATVALLGGCADMIDYNQAEPDHHDDDRTKIMEPIGSHDGNPDYN